MKNSKEYLDTINSLKKLDDNLYYLDYYLDYDLDGVINKNSKYALTYYLNIKKILKKKIGFACSTFDVKNQKGEHLFARNYDYRNSPSLVMKIHSSKGYKSICMTSLNFLLTGYSRNITKHKKNLIISPYVIMDGMNEKGLAIAVLELHNTPTKQNNNDKFINTTLAMRIILDKCQNIQEAIAILKDNSMRALLGYDYHFQIVDKEHSIVVEYINNEIEIIKSDKGYQCLTNHYISKKAKDKKVIINSKGTYIETSGYDRIKIIKETLNKNKGIMSEEDAMKLLYKVRQHYYFILMFFLRYYVDTIYSCVYNVDKLSMIVSRDNKEYKFKL